MIVDDGQVEGVTHPAQLTEQLTDQPGHELVVLIAQALRTAGIDRVFAQLGEALLQAAFGELIRRGEDASGLMRRVAGHLADVAEESFASERSPDGVPWVDLAELTKASRARRGHWPGQKLQVSGALAVSITTDYGRDWAQIGSNVPYARIQQEGGQAGRNRKVTIPAREYLGISPEAEEAIRDDMVAWVDLNRLVSG